MHITPSRVLSEGLINVVQRGKEMNSVYERMASDYGRDLRLLHSKYDQLEAAYQALAESGRKLNQHINELQTDNAELRIENEKLNQGIEAIKSMYQDGVTARQKLLEQLTKIDAENESLRKDAGRYRYIRDNFATINYSVEKDWDGCKLITRGCAFGGKHLESVIDAAMGEGK